MGEVLILQNLISSLFLLTSVYSAYQVIELHGSQLTTSRFGHSLND